MAHDTGLLLAVPSAMTLVSVPVALLTSDPVAVAVLVTAGVTTGSVAAGLAHRFRSARTLDAWPAMEVVAVGWLLSALVGAAVLFAIAHLGASPTSPDAVYRDPANAFLEAMSGITSTGLTIAGGNESRLSPVLQWWRSILQWVGGVGVVLFAAGFAHTAASVNKLFESEVGNEDIGDPRQTVRAVIKIYAGLTVAAIVAFQLAFDDAWEALNHALTAVSTGGFTITDDSLAGANTAGTLVAMVVIVAGSVSFVGHQLLLAERDPSRWWRLTKTRAHVSWLLGGIVGTAALATLLQPEISVLDRVFQWVSASGTAGFSTADDLGAWQSPLLLLLVLAMVIGPPSASTGGGVKLDRMTWLTKGLLGATRARTAGTDAGMSWDGKVVSDGRRRRGVRNAAVTLLLWLVTGAAGTAVVATVTDARWVHVVFDVASAMSNVGLGVGVVGPELDGVAKITFTVLMYLGRLELLAALILAAEPERAEDTSRS